MKTIILTLALILIVPIATALDECKGTMETNEIPCLLLLPVNQTTTSCTSLNVSIYTNGSTLLYRQEMYPYNNFKCNATFNQTAFGTYTGQYDTEDTFSIVVEEDDFQQYYLYIVVLIVFFILVGLGYWLEEGVFTMIAGMLAMIIGLNIFVNGFPNLVNEFLKNSMVVVIWGVGAYLIIPQTVDFFGRLKGEE